MKIKNDIMKLHSLRSYSGIFTIRKEILWESETASDSEVNAKEVEFIRALRSNDPKIGYNQWPRGNG